MSNDKERPHSALFFERIANESKHPKSLATAGRIRDACDYLLDHKIPISISEVAHLCQAKGPKAQSIRNNKLLVAYIKARRSEQNLPIQMQSVELRHTTDDPQINEIIHCLELDAARERSQKENLIRALRSLGEYDLRAILETGRLVQYKQEDPVSRDFSVLAKTLLDPTHLRKFGLVLDDGRIFAPSRNNRVFLGKTEVLQLLDIKRAVENSA